ncbi:MAG: DUF4179 domain-containing protein [Lachnospiraceae bacterium]
MKKERIFTEDIEVPGIVTQKAEAAFAQIRKDGTKSMKKITKKKFWKTPAAVAASICLVLVGGISVAAAVQHFWGNAIEQDLQGTDEQKEKLEDAGMATVMADNDVYKDQAVTVNGVTITPNVVISDENFVRVSFYVSGYALKENMAPEFAGREAYIGNDPKEGGMIWSSGFFDGIVNDGDKSTYVDGTPVETVKDDEGYESDVPRYTDSKGRLEFSFYMHDPVNGESFLGKSIHLPSMISDRIRERWEMFRWMLKAHGNLIKLSEKSMAKKIQVNKKIPDTVFTLKYVEVSPISVVAYTKGTGNVENPNDDFTAINVIGVLLKNGQKMAYSYGGDYEHINDGTKGTAIKAKMSLNQIIDPEEVRGIVLRSDLGKEYTVEFDN